MRRNIQSTAEALTIIESDSVIRSTQPTHCLDGLVFVQGTGESSVDLLLALMACLIAIEHRGLRLRRAQYVAALRLDPASTAARALMTRALMHHLRIGQGAELELTGAIDSPASRAGLLELFGALCSESSEEVSLCLQLPRGLEQAA